MSARLLILLLPLLLFACAEPESTPPAAEANAGLFDAAPQKVASDYEFTEGPASDAEGNIYFTDQPNNRILKWTTDNEITVFMEDAGRANGLYVDHAGNLLACADEKNQLWSISPAGEVTVLLDNFEGKRFNGPNDLWIAPDGGIYFTDPFYQRDYWSHTNQEIEEQRLYYLSPDKQTLQVAAAGFVRPNGLIGTADGKTLYVADIGDNKTYSFTVNDDASLSNRTLLTELGSDGMTLDEKGNIYLTGEGVHVFDPAGTKLAHIPINEKWTANVTFGGKDRKTLFITAMGSVYTVDMNVAAGF